MLLLLLLYHLHAKHIQVDITMLLLQGCCRLSHACSMSTQSPKDSSQIGNPASGNSKHDLIIVGLQASYATTRLMKALLGFQDHACCAGPFTAWQVALPTKAIHVKAADKEASVAATAAAGSAAAGHLGAPPTPLKTPPYSALRTPRTPVLLDAFGRGDSTNTHFAPPESKLAADHTLKTLGLAFNMYETFLGCKFPYKALQTVSCSTLSHGEPILSPCE